MEERYLKVIETLSAKLGTTAEHLWGVLIKQAAISGTVDLVLCLSLIALSTGLVTLVHRKTLVPEPTKGNKYPSAEWGEDATVFGVCVTVFVVIVTFFFTLGNVDDIVTAFANPEYWALHQLTN